MKQLRKRKGYYATPEEAEAAARKLYYRPADPPGNAHGKHGLLAEEGGKYHESWATAIPASQMK